MTIDSAIFTNNQVGIGTPTPAYSLDVDGDIRATGSIFVSDRVITHASFATSDARYKHSVAPLDDGLALVRQLAPRRFSYTDDAPMANKDRVYYGLIAQEAAQVDPNLVETFLLPTPTEIPKCHLAFNCSNLPPLTNFLLKQRCSPKSKPKTLRFLPFERSYGTFPSSPMLTKSVG